MASGLLAQLSSQVGDRTQAATLQVAERCVEEPGRLAEIAGGLTSKDGKLAADCAEVFTQVALERAEVVAPYAAELAAQLGHKASRVRWECAHALSLIAATPPATTVVAGLLGRLSELIQRDGSVIVRDYTTSTLATYAAASPEAAQAAYPHLREALEAWEGKHAARALEGLKHVAGQLPGLRGELVALAAPYGDHGKATIRRAAKGVLRLLG